MINVFNRKAKRIFIVGCGHSGTSILIRLLGYHSSVYPIPGETGLFLHEKFSETDIIDHLANFDEQMRANDAVAWVEKTPRHIEKIQEIIKYSPRAKIIGMVRDPRDTACSIKARGFTFKQGLERWVKDNTLLSKHINQRYLLILRLEDLTQNPEQLLKQTFSFLELPHQNLLDYHKQKQSWYSEKVVLQKPSNSRGQNHEHYRNWQINQPLFKSTERYKKDMSSSDWDVFNTMLDQVRPLAKRFNYLDI